MKKQSKKYSKPRRPFDKARIDEENTLREKYGLKNKKEIWKADAAIGRIRNQAKGLITASEEEKQEFVDRLQKRGFSVESIAGALALNKEDILKRRLQTIVHVKKITTTAKQGRQLITHKHIAIGDQIVNIPSYHVGLEEEGMVKSDIVLKIKSPEKSKVEKIKEEVEEKVVGESESEEKNENSENLESSHNDNESESSDEESGSSGPEDVGDTKTEDEGVDEKEVKEENIEENKE
ncbi:30S ribosomal protein S4 [Candidatus Pacearchaeota archaeon]|nr:30S ribosomal protein S4 [Candidatus Pacearchaeota archaeon]